MRFICLFFVVFCSSLICKAQGDSKGIAVEIKLEKDTIFLDSMRWASFELSIQNIDHDTFSLQEDYLVCGYLGDTGSDWVHYYIEMYSLDQKGGKRVLDYMGNYPLKEYLGDYVLMNKGSVKTYNEITWLYPVDKVGVYKFRVVFYNKLSFLGKSNWVQMYVKEWVDTGQDKR